MASTNRRSRAAAAVVASVAVLVPLRALPQPSTGIELSERILVSTPGHRMGEFAVARNPADPQHLVVAGMDWDDPAGSVGCATFVSRDGGRSWKRGASPAGLDTPFARFDPWVAIDPQGRAHLQCLKFTADPLEYAIGTADGETGRPSVLQMHARSDDGGDTWGAAARIPPKHEKNQVDKNALHAARNGTLYACINDYPRGGDDLVVSRSLDGGETWEPPVILDRTLGIDTDTSSGFGNCNGFAEGPNGEVYIGWTGLYASEPFVRFGTVATFDGGDTWTNGTAIGGWSQPGSAQPFPLNAATNLLVYPSMSFSSIGASRVTGDVFVALQQHDPATDRMSTKLYRSRDRGASYEVLAMPAAPSSTCTGCHEMRPTLTVDERGRLAVQYVVTSNAGLRKETWLLVSADGGTTWLEPIQLSGTDADESYLNPRNWTPAESEALLRQTAFIAGNPGSAGSVAAWEAVARGQRTDHIRWGGDYWGITSSPEGFVALWEDHHAGGRSQLWARIVTVP